MQEIDIPKDKMMVLGYLLIENSIIVTNPGKGM